jgi:hypothetical protein
MTRTIGLEIIRAPCCGAEYSIPAYGSVNLSACEYWSDGRKVHGLFSTDGGLCKCICGSLYAYKECKSIRLIRGASINAPVENRSIFDKLFGLNKSKKESALRGGFLMPPRATLVNDNEVKEFLKPQYIHGSLVEGILRRRYWRILNDPIRESFKIFRSKNPGDLLPFKSSLDHFNNLNRLYELVIRNGDSSLDERVELLREMGRFNEAKILLRNVDPDEMTIHAIQLELVEKRYRGPVRYWFG